MRHSHHDHDHHDHDHDHRGHHDHHDHDHHDHDHDHDHRGHHDHHDHDHHDHDHDHRGRGRGRRRRIYGDLESLEGLQRDLEQAAADIAERIRRIKEPHAESAPEPSTP